MQPDFALATPSDLSTDRTYEQPVTFNPLFRSSPPSAAAPSTTLDDTAMTFGRQRANSVTLITQSGTTYGIPLQLDADNYVTVGEQLRERRLPLYADMCPSAMGLSRDYKFDSRSRDGTSA